MNLKAKLIDYLENQIHFRDYTIQFTYNWGKINRACVHQKVNKDTFVADVANAIHNFQRDGHSSIIFYVTK